MTSTPYTDNPTSYRGGSGTSNSRRGASWIGGDDSDDSSNRSDNDDHFHRNNENNTSNISGSLGIIVEENDRDMKYVPSSSVVAVDIDDHILNDVPLDGSIREECARPIGGTCTRGTCSIDNYDDRGDSLPHVEEIKMSRTNNNKTTGRRLKKIFRSYKLYLVLLFAIVILLVIIIPTTKKNSSSSTSTASNPKSNDTSNTITFNRNSTKEGIFDFLREEGIYAVDIEQIITNVKSPQHRAAMWLAHDDPANLKVPHTTDDATMRYKYLARYILAVNYYALQAPSHWITKLGFLSEGNICTWKGTIVHGEGFVEAGVFCDKPISGIPTKIHIFNNNVTGKIPTENGYLTSLTHFDMSYNDITGTIPMELCKLPNIQVLDVSNNRLKGVIPTCFGTTLASSLKWLYLNNNGLSGSLSTHLSSLIHLERFIIESNQFTGDPSTIFNGMKSLRMLYASHNNFSGTIDPNFLAGHKALEVLDVSHNNFTLNVSEGSTFPHHLVTLYNLTQLDLSNNPLHGTFPKVLVPKKELNRKLHFLSMHETKMRGHLPDFHQLIGLKHLDLSRNSFEGTIPQYFGSNMTNLELLYLSDNKDMDHSGGTIPDNFAHLTKLRDLSLRNINITGTIPSFIGNNLTNLVMLDLGINNLTSSIPNNFNNLKKLEYLLLNGNLQLHGGVHTLTQHLKKSLKVLLIDGTKIPLSSIQCPNTLEVDTNKSVSTLEVYVECTTPNTPPCPCCKCCKVSDGLSCSKPLLGNVDASWKDTFDRKTYIFFEEDENK